MPFIKSTPAYKLDNKNLIAPSIYYYERFEEAKHNINYWCEFLNKGTLTIEEQRRCINLIEEEELNADKYYSEYKKSLK